MAAADLLPDLDHLYVQFANLSIQTFNLYKSPTAQDPTSLYDLCASSCQVIESFDSLETSRQITLSASGHYFYLNLMVPCHALLRLLKTSFSRYIDVDRAKAALFLGIGLHKRMSLQNDDLPARNAVALTQLWNSNRVFHKPSGAEAAALRIRSRLFGSIVLDGLVWWREEFGGAMGVYAPPVSDVRGGRDGKQGQVAISPVAGELTAAEGTAGNDSTVTANMSALSETTMPAPARLDYSNFLDDPMLSEFGWPVGDDIFSSEWADMTVGTV